MTLVKKGKQIPVQQEGNHVDGRATAKKIAERVGTPSLIWLLVKRHKIGLLVIGNVILILNWVFPPWTEIAKSLVAGLF